MLKAINKKIILKKSLKKKKNLGPRKLRSKVEIVEKVKTKCDADTRLFHPHTSQIVAKRFVEDVQDCLRPLSHLYPAGVACARFHRTQSFTVTPVGTNVAVIVSPTNAENVGMVRLFNAADTNVSDGTAGTAQPTFPFGATVPSASYRVVGCVVRVMTTGTLLTASGVATASVYSVGAGVTPALVPLVYHYDQGRFGVEGLNHGAAFGVTWFPTPGAESKSFEYTPASTAGHNDVHILMQGLSTGTVMTVYVDICIEWIPTSGGYLYGTQRWKADAMAYEMAINMQNEIGFPFIKKCSSSDLQRPTHSSDFIAAKSQKLERLNKPDNNSLQILGDLGSKMEKVLKLERPKGESKEASYSVVDGDERYTLIGDRTFVTKMVDGQARIIEAA